MADGKVFISNVNSLAVLCDRPSIENHKVAYFENKKREEQRKETNKNLVLIARWDDASRDACELRALIKQEIDGLFKHVVETGAYDYAQEVRTFAPGKRASFILDEMYAKCAYSAVSGELAAAFERELNVNTED